MNEVNARMRAPLAPRIARIEPEPSAAPSALPRALSIKALCQQVSDRAAPRALAAHSQPVQCAVSPQFESTSAHCSPASRHLDPDGLAHWLHDKSLCLMLRDGALIFTVRDGKPLAGAQPSAALRQHVEGHRGELVSLLTLS